MAERGIKIHAGRCTGNWTLQRTVNELDIRRLRALDEILDGKDTGWKGHWITNYTGNSTDYCTGQDIGKRHFRLDRTLDEQELAGRTGHWTNRTLEERDTGQQELDEQDTGRKGH